MERSFPVFHMDRLPLPDTEALRFSEKMGLGFNIGNSLDCVDTHGNTTEGLAFETLWGNPETTPQMIRALYDTGFRSVRLPVSWHNHISGPEDTIDEAWMQRVETVVRQLLDAGFYVEINTHHDVREDLLYPDFAHREQSIRLFRNLWKQIAARFRDYDERLIFEPMNELRLTGTPYEWSPDPEDAQCREAFEVINELNQIFVDLIRESGGNNRTRFLSIPGYSTSEKGVLTDAFVLPKDPTPDRLFVSVHNYAPPLFTFALTEGDMDLIHFDPFGAGKELPPRTAGPEAIDRSAKALYEKFTSKGIPVHFNEFGTVDKDNPEDRIVYNAYYVARSASIGGTCFYWDNGILAHHRGAMGILDRHSCTFPDRDIPQEMLRYTCR